MKGKFDVKKLWKRNQIMITALAFMIAIAGYLNFTGKQIDDEILFTTSAQFEEADASVVEETLPDAQSVYDENAELYDISDEDAEYYTEIESLDEDISLSEIDVYDEETAENVVETSAEVAQTEVAQAEEEEIPGEAVFTNTVSVTSLAEANLIKEQTRAQNKEALLDIINNENVSDEAKQEAVSSMIALTDLAQKECETLVMLEAKGFPDAVVSINGDSVDVCIGMNELTQAQIAQIEDIVKRKTGIAAENIIISPVGEK
jgi:stage III sporulation protein AH